MWIERDIAERLKRTRGYFAQILIGPRQCGKSTLLSKISQGKWPEVTFDDFQMRNLATRDPALFFVQNPPPLVVDEVQYVPEIFPEIKRQIDLLKKERLKHGGEVETIFRLTGSNQILLDANVKESLVGRAAYFYLSTLSVHEILRAYPNQSLGEVLFKGGWPELYINDALDSVTYLNEYIRNYIEKDVVFSAGIVKKKEFHTVLGMLASRTGQIVNHSSIAKDSGVKSVTIHEWLSLLERTGLFYLLPPYESNLNKRLIRSPKLYLLDTGLAVRLQGWLEEGTLLKSPQAGSLFETLVFAEIIKCSMNFGKNWKVSYFRTKEGEEVDFLIENQEGKMVALEAKLAIHGAQPHRLPKALQALVPSLKESVVVTFGGKKMALDKQSIQVPIQELTAYLLSLD